MKNEKLRVIKDFHKLDEEIQEQIKLVYPYGFNNHLIRFTDKEGKNVSALPFETDEKYYLVRMTATQARQLIEEDLDYDAEGNLKDSVRDEYEDKHADVDYMSDYFNEEGDEEGEGKDDDF